MSSKYASILWIKEGTRTTVPVKDITSPTSEPLNECTAKFRGTEHAGLVLMKGTKAECDQATKAGIEKVLIEKLKNLEVELKKSKKSENEKSEQAEKSKVKLAKAAKQLQKSVDLKSNFIDLLNAAKKIEAVFNSMVIDNVDNSIDAKTIYDKEHALVLVTEKQAAALNAAKANFNPFPDGNQLAKLPSQGLHTKTVIGILIPGIDWKESNYSDLKQSNPRELDFALSQTRNLFKNLFSLELIQSTLRSAKSDKKKKAKADL